MNKESFAGEMVYDNGSPALYEFEGISGLSDGLNTAVAKTRLPIIDEGNQEWSEWGDDNLFPYHVDAEVRENGVLTKGFDLLLQAHFGKGIYTYIDEITEDGKLLKKIIQDTESSAFLKLSNGARFMAQLINDYHWFRNLFIELIFDKAGKKIALIKRLDPIHCRWEKSNKGNIKNLYVSTKWPSPKKEEYKLIPALDVDFPLMDLQNMSAEGKIKPNMSLILPVRLNNGGNVYYDKTPWDGIRASWLLIALNVPKMRLAVQKFRWTIKYHVKVPYNFWERKYGDEWTGWDKSYQDTKIAEWRKKMDTYLMGVENSGKTFISFYDRDMLNNKIYDEIIIEVIEDKMGDLKWLTESQIANGENLFAIGVDSAVLGQGTPGGSEAGSGSNKREAFAIMQALMGLPRQLVFTPLEIVRDFNGWNDKIQFGHVDVDTSQTLDQNPTGKQTQLS